MAHALLLVEPDPDAVVLHLLLEALEGGFGDELAELGEALEGVGLGLLDELERFEALSQFFFPGFYGHGSHPSLNGWANDNTLQPESLSDKGPPGSGAG